MDDLLKKKCLPCEGGALPFDISEIHKYQKKVDGWEILEEKKIFFLHKKFNFKNFKESQNFVNNVGKVSEEEGHHPDIIFGWGYAKINITTHAIEGLSENDFIFNSYLVFTASIVDAAWYIFLTFIVTSDIVLRFLKNKSIIIHRIIGVLFIIISAILLIDIIK